MDPAVLGQIYDTCCNTHTYTRVYNTSKQCGKCRLRDLIWHSSPLGFFRILRISRRKLPSVCAVFQLYFLPRAYPVLTRLVKEIELLFKWVIDFVSHLIILSHLSRYAWLLSFSFFLIREIYRALYSSQNLSDSPYKNNVQVCRRLKLILSC